MANARGNILENTDLLDSLNKTKHSSTTVSRSLAEFELLQTKLENVLSKFPSVVLLSPNVPYVDVYLLGTKRIQLSGRRCQPCFFCTERSIQN